MWNCNFSTHQAIFFLVHLTIPEQKEVLLTVAFEPFFISFLLLSLSTIFPHLLFPLPFSFFLTLCPTTFPAFLLLSSFLIFLFLSFPTCFHTFLLHIPILFPLCFIPFYLSYFSLPLPLFRTLPCLLSSMSFPACYFVFLFIPFAPFFFIPFNSHPFSWTNSNKWGGGGGPES